MSSMEQKLEELSKRQETQLALMQDLLQKIEQQQKQSSLWHREVLSEVQGCRDELSQMQMQQQQWSSEVAPAASEPAKDTERVAAADPAPVAAAEEQKISELNTQETPVKHDADHHDLNLGFCVTGEGDSIKLEMVMPQQDRHLTTWQKIQELVDGIYFDMFFGMLIIVNTVCMSMELQWIGENVGYALGYRFILEPENWYKQAFVVTDYTFVIIFLIELLLRIAVLQRKFFLSRWNWLDVVIVTVSIVNLSLGQLAVDAMMVRLLRLMKLTRVLRMARVAGLLEPLNTIIQSVLACRIVLFWSMLLLWVVHFICGMVVCNLVQDFLSDPDADEDRKMLVFTYYGTFSKTMITMFEITHVNYSRAARILQENVNEHWAWFFIAYRIFVGFAMLTVVRAVFLQQTLRVAEHDLEHTMRKKAKEIVKYKKRLEATFKEICGPDTNEITKDDFKEVLSQDAMSAWMLALDIQFDDVDKLFEILDSNANGGVGIEEFISVASRLRGQARSLDLFTVGAQLDRVEQLLVRQTRARPCVARPCAVAV